MTLLHVLPSLWRPRILFAYTVWQRGELDLY